MNLSDAPGGALPPAMTHKLATGGAQALKYGPMSRELQAEWDQEQADRNVGIALGRLREARPGHNNERIRQVCGEIESAHRLRKPASLRDSLTALHVLLDEVEDCRTIRERRGRRG